MKFTRHAHRSPIRGIAPLLLALALPAGAIAAPPTPAAAEGFDVNTFSSNFTAQTVDLNQTRNRGFKWFLYDFYGKKASPSIVHLNGDGSMTLNGSTPGTVGTLTSVSQYPGTNAWVGNAFGGGAYIEVSMAFSQAQVAAGHAAGAQSWPAFWSMAMEGNVTAGNQWPGQPTGYTHTVEMDMFEGDVWWKPSVPAYGSGLHDWYGIPGKTCPPGTCVVSMVNPSGERDAPAGTNTDTLHTYGFLWVAATASTKGSFATYFDGKLVGYTVSWTQYTNQAPTPVGKTWTYGQLDNQHMYFILGTGNNIPFTLASVNVWQKSAAENMTND